MTLPGAQNASQAYSIVSVTGSLLPPYCLALTVRASQHSQGLQPPQLEKSGDAPWDIVGLTRNYGTYGTHLDMLGIVGLGGTYKDFRDLVGHTRNCGSWWDILGLGGTYWDLRDLVGHTRNCGTRQHILGLAGHTGTW